MEIRGYEIKFDKFIVSNSYYVAAVKDDAVYRLGIVIRHSATKWEGVEGTIRRTRREAATDLFDAWMGTQVAYLVNELEIGTKINTVGGMFVADVWMGNVGTDIVEEALRRGAVTIPAAIRDSGALGWLSLPAEKGTVINLSDDGHSLDFVVYGPGMATVTAPYVTRQGEPLVWTRVPYVDSDASHRMADVLYESILSHNDENDIHMDVTHLGSRVIDFCVRCGQLPFAYASTGHAPQQV